MFIYLFIYLFIYFYIVGQLMTAAKWLTYVLKNYKQIKTLWKIQ